MLTFDGNDHLRYVNADSWYEYMVTFKLISVTKCSHLMGIISCGMTGRIFFEPPRANKSSIPWKEEKFCTKLLKEKSFLSLEKYQVTNLNLNSKEDVRVLCFPESVKEEGEVVVVVQGLKGYLIVEKLKNDMTVTRKLMQDVIQKKRWR